jgi:adenine C2-methylase RlmN of 23S rRNA A2503 and tRNA A37
VRCSRIDPFVKYSLESRDGEIVETVRIPLERHGNIPFASALRPVAASVCLCATSRLGLLRNLETWE